MRRFRLGVPMRAFLAVMAAGASGCLILLAIAPGSIEVGSPVTPFLCATAAAYAASTALPVAAKACPQGFVARANEVSARIRLCWYAGTLAAGAIYWIAAMVYSH